MVLEFPSLFWDDSVDYFGAAGEPTGAAQPRHACHASHASHAPAAAAAEALHLTSQLGLPLQLVEAPTLPTLTSLHPALLLVSAEEARGRCFMFWNFHRFTGTNTLAALVSGGQGVAVAAGRSAACL